MRRLGVTKRKAAYNNGFNTGYNNGFRTGYDDGYISGHQVGISDSAFEGTSIVIPTYNQMNYLRECIESIRKYTPQPYELIVVDNGSDDGTVEYLKSLSAIRYKLLPDNRGFAGAVNQGLMLARGTTRLILNNDSVVTMNWLGNLLRCLYSSSHIGIVGPVTNYISGDQQIDVPYSNTLEMQQFAASYNQSDAKQWVVTDRMTGFCMLFRRETFMNLGYFDEGFEIGNCEDDDYGLRARLMGVQLVIAKDTFIHHYGSVSMKSLNTRFDEVYGRNLLFYAEKWTDPYGYLTLKWQMSMRDVQHRAVDFYPTCVIVQGVGSTVYWLENGIRYPISNDCGMQAIRVSQVDLQSWQLGEAISSDTVLQRIQALQWPESDNPLMEGNVVRINDGNVYQYKSGKLHPFMNMQALTSWNINTYQIQYIENNEQHDHDAPPIICPPLIKANNI